MSESLDELFKSSLSEAKSEAEREQIDSIRKGEDSVSLAGEFYEEEGEEPKEEEAQNLFTQIRDMSIPQKIKLAMFGNQMVRAILIRDTNRQIPLYVLENAQITDNEISEFARNTNLDEGIFRAINRNSKWMKNYTIKLALVSNPKVPVDISLKWIKFLRDRDLKQLSKSKNIPGVIASQCRKTVEGRKK